MSEEKPKHWRPEKFLKQGGEVDVRIGEPSNNTSSDVKLAGRSIESLRSASEYVPERRWQEGYLEAIRALVMKRDASAAGYGRYAFERGEVPTADDYVVLIAEIRQKFPELDGHIGRFITPDAELKELIDKAWKEEKINFRVLFAKAIARAARNGGFFKLSEWAVLKYLYRESRKQAKAGRPRKNSA
jgi:hypothetical protein